MEAKLNKNPELGINFYVLKVNCNLIGSHIPQLKDNLKFTNDLILSHGNVFNMARYTNVYPHCLQFLMFFHICCNF